MLRFKLILFAISAVFYAGAQADIVPIKPGTMIPESNTQLKSVDGKTTTLKESMGKNGLIVIFSATTCPFVIGGRVLPDGRKTTIPFTNPLRKQV